MAKQKSILHVAIMCCALCLFIDLIIGGVYYYFSTEYSTIVSALAAKETSLTDSNITIEKLQGDALRCNRFAGASMNTLNLLFQFFLIAASSAAFAFGYIAYAVKKFQGAGHNAL